jgi:hypothetical protein
VCNLYVEVLLVDGGERFFIVYKITGTPFLIIATILLF